jgi:hypothetical protein
MTSRTSEDECKWWLAPNDLFSWNKNTVRHGIFYGDTLCTLCYSLYNARDTHSVHNYLLKSWWSRLLCPRSSCYVFPPALSRINWCSLPIPGGPGPPTPKVASLFPGSAHSLPMVQKSTYGKFRMYVAHSEWIPFGKTILRHFLWGKGWTSFLTNNSWILA